MHRSIYHIYLCIFTTLIPFAYSSLLLHQRDDGYEFAICHPSVAPGNPLPPCVSVDNQQYSCAPSSNTPSYLQSAQSCICNSSFFQDWVGCRNCLYYHGILNQDWYNAWKAEINSVSLAYCYGTPTAYFPDVFKSMTSAMPSVNTAPIGYFDQAPGNTAVSLYYTAAGGGQGSGPTTTIAAGTTTYPTYPTYTYTTPTSTKGPAASTSTTLSIQFTTTLNAASTSTTSSIQFTTTLNAASTSGTKGGSGAVTTSGTSRTDAFEFVAPGGSSTMTVFAFGGGAMPTGNPGLGYVLAVVGGAILAAQ